MSYGKVHDAFWESERIAGLSDRAALLALFLLTGPHRNAIGCFKLGTGAITDIERFGNWGIEGASDALSELVRSGFIVRDDRTGWTFVTNALKHDPIKGARTAVHALSLLQRVPTNNEVYQALIEKLLPQLEGEAKALDGKEGWPIEPPLDAPSKGHAIPKPSPSPSPLPEPSPEPKPARGASLVFEGKVIRLNAKDFADWEAAYRHLDLRAELTALDAWYDENLDDAGRKKWFPRASAALAKKNAERKATAKPEDRGAGKLGSELTDEERLAQENYIRGKNGKPPKLPNGAIDWDSPPITEMPAHMRAFANGPGDQSSLDIPASLDRRPARNG